MVRYIRTMLAIATAAVLVTAFAKPDRSGKPALANARSDPGAQSATMPQRELLLFLADTLPQSRVFVHGLPPMDAMLAAAVLALPFGYSTYRTLRRKHHA